MNQKAVAAGLVTALLALAALVYRAQVVEVEWSAPFAPAFRGESRGPGAMANEHDGQAFGSLALDPLLSAGSEWRGGTPELAYRATRPLLGWLVMLTSFGSRRLVAWSLLVWTAVGAGVLAAAASTLAGLWGRRREWAPLLLLLPGVFGQLLVGGLSDGLAAGLALLGMAWWLQGRDKRAMVALCFAALCRESTLIVPLALVLTAERPRVRRLLVPFAVYAAWIAVVWLRLGVLPTDPGEGRLAIAFMGLLRAAPSWGWMDVMSAASVAGLAAIAFCRAPCRQVRCLVGLSVLFASTLGELVWRSWDFTRPLLPVTVVGACLLARRAVDVGPGGGLNEPPIRRALSRHPG